jgi:hypothetical protein
MKEKREMKNRTKTLMLLLAQHERPPGSAGEAVEV